MANPLNLLGSLAERRAAWKAKLLWGRVGGGEVTRLFNDLAAKEAARRAASRLRAVPGRGVNERSFFDQTVKFRLFPLFW